jgi:Flp pilus assembly pilin Flp
MSDLILRTAVATRLCLSSLAARLVSDERGQDAIEYVGVLAIVAVIIGVVIAVASGLNHPITSGVSKEISKIFK